MKLKTLGLCLSALALLWAGQLAQAGVIREAGKGIGKGSVVVAHGTEAAAGATAGGVATAGKATGSAVASGATAVGKGAVAAPGVVYRGTKGGAKKIWKATW